MVIGYSICLKFKIHGYHLELPRYYETKHERKPTSEVACANRWFVYTDPVSCDTFCLQTVKLLENNTTMGKSQIAWIIFSILGLILLALGVGMIYVFKNIVNDRINKVSSSLDSVKLSQILHLTGKWWTWTLIMWWWTKPKVDNRLHVTINVQQTYLST